LYFVSPLVLQVCNQRHKACADAKCYNHDPEVVHVPAVTVSASLAKMLSIPTHMSNEDCIVEMPHPITCIQQSF
jgi:hypothetical protein